MKGVILAGGTGSRLKPLTDVTNKHLLPIYNQPMIMYPLVTLKNAGITEILIVTGGEHIGDFHRLLKSGAQHGVKLNYTVQDGPGGIAEALGLAKGYTDGESLAVILGDNIYEEPQDMTGFTSGARVYLKTVTDAYRFGCPKMSPANTIETIIEKPEEPPSTYAVTGLYLYDEQVFDIIKHLKRSERGELEITDVNNHYLKREQLTHTIVNGHWTDAGTFESLSRAAYFVRKNILERETH